MKPLNLGSTLRLAMNDFLGHTVPASEVMSLTGLDPESRALLVTLSYIMRETAELERTEISRSLAWRSRGWLRLLQDGDLPRNPDEISLDHTKTAS